MHWFTFTWWGYLFAPRSKYSDLGKIRTAICRARSHPVGVWWYNPHRTEPDMRCKNCDDDLG